MIDTLVSEVPWVSTHKQTPEMVADEFLKAVDKVKVDNKDADALFDHFTKLEDKNKTPIELMNLVTQRNNGILNIYNLSLFTDRKIKATPHLLAWIGSMSSDIPEYITTMLGIYATKFYTKRDIQEVISLRYISELGMRGQIISFRDMRPWSFISRSQNPERDEDDKITKLSIFEYWEYDKNKRNESLINSISANLAMSKLTAEILTHKEES